MRDDFSRLVGLEGFVVTAVEVIGARRFLHAPLALVESSAPAAQTAGRENAQRAGRADLSP